MSKKGFTLIELLVVIAIIGILASIVLVSLSGARDRAKDARITSDMAQVRTVATISNDTYNDYKRICCAASGVACGSGETVDSEMVTLCDDVDDQKDNDNTYNDITFNYDTNYTNYCAVVTLNSGNWYCVDSQLVSKLYTTDPSANVVGSDDCSGAEAGDFVCP